MNNLLLVLLQTAPAGKQSPYSSMIFLLLIIVVFYFFMIRPQAKRQKELKKMRDGLQKGDKVITTGGIYGKIVELQDNSVSIEVDNNVKIRVDKSAIIKDSSDLVQPK